jgi:hypothetical protein
MTDPTKPPEGSTGGPITPTEQLPQPLPSPTQPQPRVSTPAALQARGATLAVSNLIKLGGLVGAVNEMVIRPDLRPPAVALCGVMLLGAQLSEDLVLRALDRFLGREAPAP